MAGEGGGFGSQESVSGEGIGGNRRNSGKIGGCGVKRVWSEPVRWIGWSNIGSSATRVGFWAVYLSIRMGYLGFLWALDW